MKPLSLLTNLSINDIVGNGQTEASSDSKVPILQGQTVHLLVLEEAMGQAITQCLSGFQFPFKRVKLKNISVLNKGITAYDIIPILQHNLDEHIQTVVIGSQSSCVKACFDSFQFREKYFNTALVQPSAGEEIDRIIFDVKRPWLQGLFLIGNQAHLSNQDYLLNAESEGLHAFRLGGVRSEPGSVEPEIRISDLFGMSLNVLKNTDAPIQSSVSATGLMTEEVCQLMYYAGRSDQNKITTIFDFSPATSKSDYGTKLLSTLVWYFLHGLNYRSTIKPQQLSGMKKFSIENPVQGHHLVFYKDEREQKWWLESPFKKRVLAKEMPLIACDYQDYRAAANEQLLTERLNIWFNLYESSQSQDDSL